MFSLFLSENQNLVKKLAWVCIAVKWQIGCGLKNDYFTTKLLVPGTCCKWIKCHNVIWVLWIGYPGACLFLEEPITGLLSLNTANLTLCHHPAIPSSLLVSMPFCLVLLEFVFAGLNRGYVNTSKLFCKGDSRFDKFGSYIYCFSALFFLLTI